LPRFALAAGPKLELTRRYFAQIVRAGFRTRAIDSPAPCRPREREQSTERRRPRSRRAAAAVRPVRLPGRDSPRRRRVAHLTR